MAPRNPFAAIFANIGGAIASATGAAGVGSQTITGTVPAGATANAKKNGTVLGAATVTAQGVASYGPVTLVAGDQVSFSWSLAGETPAATAAVTAPTLNALTVSAGSATVGAAYTGTVSGQTSGSTPSLTGAGAAGLSITGATISGTPTTAGAVDVVETLAGATNSPRTTSGLITVSAASGGGTVLDFTARDGTAFTARDGSSITARAA